MKEYIPSCFNIQALTNLAWEEGFHEAKEERLATVLMWPEKIRQACPKSVDRNGYSHLSSKIIRRSIRDWEKYRDFFLKHKIWLAPDKNGYMPNIKTRVFKLNIEVDHQNIEHVSFEISSKTLCNAAQREQKRKGNLCLSKTLDCSYVTKWYADIEVDAIIALADMKRITDNKLNGRVPWDSKPQSFRGKLYHHKINPRDQFLSASYAVARIANHENMQFFFDNFGGRVYTPISNITSYLRKYLRYKGKPFIGIDVQCSHPRFVNAFFQPGFWDPNSAKYEGFRKFNQKVEKHSKMKGNTGYEPSEEYGEDKTEEETREKKRRAEKDSNLYVDSFSEILSTVASGGYFQDLCPTEVDRYNAILEGDLYTWLAGLMNEENEDPSIMYTREDGKHFNMINLFTSNRFQSQSGALVKQLFAKELPTIHNLFRAVKKGHKKNLCMLLQRMECYVLLHKVCPRLYDNPDIQYFTIHDSVSTTAEHLSIVESVMREEITSFTGINPTLKYDYYGND